MHGKIVDSFRKVASCSMPTTSYVPHIGAADAKIRISEISF
jgi:hypothetical protein